MPYDREKAMVVQHDRTIFLEVNHPQYEELRDRLQAFAELVKSPENIHTYKITPLSLWNAAASGQQAEQIVQLLREHSKFPISPFVEDAIEEDMAKYYLFELDQLADQLVLRSTKQEELDKLVSYASFQPYFRGELRQIEHGEGAYWAIEVLPEKRGELKQQAIHLGYPIHDQAGYEEGDPLALEWSSALPNGEEFRLRDYQREAAQSFFQNNSLSGGHGVLVLPCGAGKTVIGMAAMVELQCAALILTTNTTSVRQWKRELLEKTSLQEEEVGEYTGQSKNIKPVTIATYQILTYRSQETDQFVHIDIFKEKKWGLIIYDEVHLLPAPVFRATALIQTTRRLGLTATLVREDGKAEDVFSLVGPKRYDLPWKTLEQKGYIAKATCTEIRVPFDSFLKEKYYAVPARQQLRIAQENPLKVPVIEELLEKHQGLPILIIGQYVDQLEDLGVWLQVPVITGKMKQVERDRLYDKFRKGELMVLAVSKVANFAIDLPDATVAIQISGTYGSRQEEAQRLGRILRPKGGRNEAFFYSIVTRETKDQEYALKRQMFLIEQGYRYQLEEVEESNGNV